MSRRIRGIYARGKIFWLAKQIKGKRTFVSLETSDYAQAVQRAAEMMEQPELQSSLGIGGDIPRFLAFKRDRKIFSKQSAIAKECTLKQFAEFIHDVTPAKVTTRQCQAFYEGLRKDVKESTAHGYMVTVRSFFKWCCDQGLCVRNPVIGVQMARVTEVLPKRFADRNLVAKLIANAPNDDMRFILYCGFHAGMRRMEIVEARPSWFKNGFIEIGSTETFIPKDRQTRTVPLSSEFAEFLKRFGSHEPFMLQPELKHRKNRYRYDFRWPFFFYMGDQKVPWITPHIMRHSFASCCAIAGVDIFRIASWLGDGIRVTQKHYAKLLPNDRAIDKVF